MNTTIMNFFSIDCSTEVGSLFAKVENKTFSKVLQSDKFLNDLIAKHIIDFLAENNIKLNDLGQIFVNQGPGSFSGLRSSLAIAKGISLSKNIKLCCYDTFIWSCAKFYNQKNDILSFVKVRQKYYVQKFDQKLNRIFQPQEVSKEEILNNYKKDLKVVPKIISEQFDDKILKLNNLFIIDLSHKELEILHLQRLLDEELIKPLYLS